MVLPDFLISYVESYADHARFTIEGKVSRTCFTIEGRITERSIVQGNRQQYAAQLCETF